MTLKGIVSKLPSYVTVSVHNSKFKAQGNPHHFISGIYKKHSRDKVILIIPIAPYHVEIYLEDDNNAPMA